MNCTPEWFTRTTKRDRSCQEPLAKANCKACHDPHVKGDPTPKQCLSCHTDKMNHQRDAAKCQGCHTFK